MSAIVELLLPEILLCVGAIGVLFLGLSKEFSSRAVVWSVLFLAGAMFATYKLAIAANGDEVFAVASLHTGPLTHYVRMIAFAIGILVVLACKHVPEAEERGEFFSLILFSFVGLSLTAIANDLVLLFLALELVSVPTYILIGLSRRDIRAQEAAGKYFFLGAFAAALTLYGFSFIYGAAGTMTIFSAGTVPFQQGAYHSIAEWFAAGNVYDRMHDPLLIVGFMLSLGGLAFKLAAVPLHYYVADVYQGAASPITGMLGFVPKFAGLIAIMHLLSIVQWQIADSSVYWGIWIIAAATMTIGNSLAFMQYNVKRMLAYSSVAHSGYLLMALLAGPGASGAGSPLRNGVAAMLFYIAIYGAMNLGAFLVLSWFRKPGTDDSDESAEMLEDLAGAARRHPWASLALAVCILGLMGFPLTGGFLGKLYIFSSVLSATADMQAHQTSLIVLVVIGAINAAVGAAYYLRIIASCYWREPSGKVTTSTCMGLRVALAVCAIVVVLGFAWPGQLIRHSVTAAKEGIDYPRVMRFHTADSHSSHPAESVDLARGRR
ncbi:MAG: NADH-quinone oxidoreductase subunit N [Phycisphaerales bacterium]|nr:NADH-quinone oxidoreductase subunit N [Phycisphaerales bacterium]MCB9857792.1 NADH-quinone oxidoreductase subunit N [Phycisphaerales bacterium]MCB9863852.1 NADH-quinone oxidoreductase subunit N [Phycisphaerales bacterium]